MSNFILLFKALFTRSFVSSTKNKKRADRTALASLLTIVLVMFLVSVLYNYMLYALFKDFDALVVYPFLVSILSFFIVFVNSIFRVNSTLFSTKDYNILTPMPIKKRDIILVKLSMFFVEQFLYSALFLLPAVVLTSISDPMFIIFGLVLLLVIPLFGMLISFILGFLISLLTNRFPKTKIITTIIYIALFALLIGGLYIYIYTDKEGGGLTTLAIDLANIPPFSFIFNGFMLYDIRDFFITLGISIASVSILVILYVIFYDSFYSAITKQADGKKYTGASTKNSKFISLVIKKDFSALFSSPTFLLNTVVGGIMSVVVSIVMVIAFKGALGEPGGEEIAKIVFTSLPLLAGMMASMSSTTVFGISLENKGFAILKSMPIDKKKYFIAKILENTIINGSLVLIASISLIFMCDFGVAGIISTLILPQLYVLFFGILGLLINLKFPNINWDSFNQIKNAKGTLINMFGELLIGMLLYVGVIFLAIWNTTFAMLILIPVFLIGIIVLYVLLMKKGPGMFDSIEC